MGVISYEVPINAQRMTIGVQGENNVREFLFDVTEWRQITGNIGTAEMVVQRNGDTSPYATVITMKDENTVSWIPTDIDTAKAGAGKIELMWIANNQTIKTKIFLMKVDPSLPYAVPDTSLDPWASWMPGIINADANYRGLTSRVDDLQQRQTSPYNFKGSCTEANLPATAEINDTWYLTDQKYRVTWTGSAWQQSSMEESKYTDELAYLKNALHDDNKIILSDVLGDAININNLSWTHGSFINENGVITPGDPLFKYSDFIPLDNGKYYIYARKVLSGAGKNVRVHGYDSSGNWVKQLLYFIPDAFEAERRDFEIDNTVTKIRISSSDYNEIVFLVNDIALTSKTLIFRKSLTSADDIHQLKLPGMYYISASSIPSNLPFTPDAGESYRLLVNKSRTASHDAESHILVGESSLWFEMYINDTWTSWHRLQDITDIDSPFMKFRKQLTSEDDMDHIALPGMYYVNLDDPPANFPSELMGVNAGRFRVLVNKSVESDNHYGELQLISGRENLYFRTGSYYNNLQPWNIVYGHRSQQNNEIQSEAIMLGLHVVPENRGVLNAIKRARQQTDIKWTSGDDIPRGFLETGDTYKSSHYTYLGTYKEGVEYTGLPYSEEHYLANDYSIDAFVTSAANPRSVMILESTGQSASHACYYGTVCTNLTSYALNIPTVDSYNWTKIDGIRTVGRLSSVNPKNLALCDILQIDGHCAIITDIISDENDNIILIEISEATKLGNINRTVTDGQFGGLSRRITMTVEEFYTWFDGFKVLRYAYLSTIPYCPNPYSPMADEGKPLAYVDFPCVPYLGNKISLATEGNRQVKILINNNLYTHLVVKKDGVAWNQDGTTNPYNIEGLDEVTITCDNGFGIYTAHMATFSNGTEATATVSCSWAIRPAITASVSVSNNKAVFTSTLKGKEFTPWFVTFGTSSDNTLGKIRDGEAIKVFDIYEVTDNEDGTYTYTFTVDYPQTNPTHARLGIRSDEYGSGSKDFTI